MLDLDNKVIQFLKQNPEQKFTAREIASWIVDVYPKECQEKQNRSQYRLGDKTALLQQIAAEIASRRPHVQIKCPEVKTTDSRPKQYCYTKSTECIDIHQGLCSALVRFLWSEFHIYSRHIHKRPLHGSRYAGTDHWFYPDVVGMEDLSQNWHREIKNIVQQPADKIRLYSFNVNALINPTNVGEVFFQAVSNATWANFGYLVASEIEDKDTLEELKILTSLRDIGFIRLNVENASKSQVLIPAKERTKIDWNTVNYLAQENRDFLDYIKRVGQFYQADKVYEPRHDI